MLRNIDERREGGSKKSVREGRGPQGEGDVQSTSSDAEGSHPAPQPNLVFSTTLRVNKNMSSVHNDLGWVSHFEILRKNSSVTSLVSHLKIEKHSVLLVRHYAGCCACFAP